MAADDVEAGQHIAFQQLTHDTMDLLMSLGLITSISERWPDDVQEQWENRLTEVRDWVRNQVTEVQEFASSYD